MPTYKVTPDELPSVIQERAIARYERVVRAIRREVLTAGPALAQAVTREGSARKPAPINLGSYVRSWQARPLDNGAVLFNDSPYGGIIERGRRPGSRPPPTKVIAEWLEQKMRGDRSIGRKERSKQAARLAWVVARAIGRRGLPAHRIMARTKRKLDPIVRRAVENALAGQEE